MTTDTVGQELSQAFRDLLDEVSAIEGKILGAPAPDGAFAQWKAFVKENG